MDYRRIEVNPIAGGIGAEIEGVDLAEELDNETFAEVHQALLDNLVIFFRKQKMTPEQHKAFGRRFGQLNIHPHYKALDGHPEILEILKEPEARGNIGGVWHSDVTFMEKPAMGSVLYALEVPPHGGDTMFANQYLAYESLSDGMRELLDGMTAVHSDATLSRADNQSSRNAERSTKLVSKSGEVVENEHPVVRTHPDTRRKALFVNKPFTVRFGGLTEEESRPLLEYLFRHAVRPEFTCRFRWEKGSVAFWDNRCTQHFAVNDYHGHRRSMHRVTVDGDRPF